MIRKGENELRVSPIQRQAIRNVEGRRIQFARLLPQVSQRSGPPIAIQSRSFENTYNTPERNYFHTAVKHHRDDVFWWSIARRCVRKRLDQAWSDLLGSFEYHDILLRFTADKYKLDLEGRRSQTG